MLVYERIERSSIVDKSNLIYHAIAMCFE
jgi:hypothetical protein